MLKTVITLIFIPIKNILTGATVIGLAAWTNMAIILIGIWAALAITGGAVILIGIIGFIVVILVAILGIIIALTVTPFVGFGLWTWWFFNINPVLVVIPVFFFIIFSIETVKIIEIIIEEIIEK